MRHRRTVITGVLGLALFAALPAAAVEAPPRPRPPTSALGLIRDMRLTVLARRALAEDEVLARHRLGVEVRDGVATLWGEVPSDGVARQARARLGAITGIHEVRSELISGAAERRDLVELSIPSRVPPRIEFEAAKPDDKTGTIRKRPSAVVVGGDVPRAVKPGGLPAVKVLPLPEKTARLAVLLPPSVVRREKPGESSRDDSPAPTLREAVARVRSSQERFRSIPVEVRGDVVVIGRGGAEDQDVAALRDALRRVRGVSEVVMSSD